MIKMNALWLMTLVFLSLMLTASCIEAGEIKVFKLRYAEPYSVANTITSLFGKQVNVAPATSINAIVVNAVDGQLLHEIEKLVAVLDRRPATIRFSVKRAENVTSTANKTGWKNSAPILQQQRSVAQSNETRTITVLEFAKAGFTDELVRVFYFSLGTESESMLLTTSHGLKISGHLTTDDRILAQVWFSTGTVMASEKLLSEIEVPAGVWVAIGGLENTSNEKNNKSALAQTKPEISRKKTGYQIDRRFLLKADIIR